MMSNPDGIEGIGGDRKFVDHLYLYYKFKEELNEKNDFQIEEKEELEQMACEQYLHAINRCFVKINELSDDNEIKQNYLNWLRWNIDVTIAELDTYESMPHLSNIVASITNCKNNINILAEAYFKLSEAEKGVSNQYVHAYQRITRSGKCPDAVYKHSGKLYINYINLLKKRHYIQKLDRDGVTFPHLEIEADTLMQKLIGFDNDLASGIKEITEMYAKIRLMDDTLRRTDDENIRRALILAHIRAQESIFERVRRQTRETISLIKLRLMENIKEAWDTSKVITRPFLHPIEGLKNVGQFILHPIQSVSEICKHAKENPWKAAVFVLGGLAIGFVAGATFTIIGAAVIDLALTSVLIPVGQLLTIGAIGGAGSVAALSMAAAGGKVVQLKSKSTEEIALENIRECARIAALTAKSEEEGRKIATQIIYEEHRRQCLKEAKERAEEIIRKIQLQEKMIEEKRKRQIDSMSPEELERLHRQLIMSEEELGHNLSNIQSELLKNQMEFRKSQADICKVQEGMSALSRLMQNVENRSGLT